MAAAHAIRTHGMSNDAARPVRHGIYEYGILNAVVETIYHLVSSVRQHANHAAGIASHCANASHVTAIPDLRSGALTQNASNVT